MKRLALSVCVIVSCLFLLTGCWNIREKSYYSDPDNFISDTATVEKIVYDSDEGILVLSLSNINAAYNDTVFVSRGKNAALLLQNNILDKVTVGDTITYISAPGCYSDGYMFPIVGLSVNEEELLSFDLGYANLLSEY